MKPTRRRDFTDALQSNLIRFSIRCFCSYSRLTEPFRSKERRRTGRLFRALLETHVLDKPGLLRLITNRSAR